MRTNIQDVVLEAGSICGFDMRSRNPGRGRAILERRMNLGIVVNHEPESDIIWVARVYVWRRESTEPKYIVGLRANSQIYMAGKRSSCIATQA